MTKLENYKYCRAVFTVLNREIGSEFKRQQLKKAIAISTFRVFLKNYKRSIK